MASIIFTILISIGIPVVGSIYAIYRKRFLPLGLGVLAFVISQLALRLPLLHYLEKYSTAYLFFSVTQPLLFALMLGVSAGIFEEIARFVAMRYVMKKRDWQAGFFFGIGHGGVEAVIFVGIGAIAALFSPTAILYSDMYWVGGIERFFAIMLHIGLSIVVLRAVVEKRFRYVILAIVIHGAVNSLIGIVPMFVPEAWVLIVLEGMIAVVAVALFTYSFWIKRKGVFHWKKG